MNDQSKGRRLAGRGLIAAAVIALPLTASVTYAEVTAPDAPTPLAAPVAPIAPSVPSPAVAPVAPLAPATPAIQLQSVSESDEAHEEHSVDRHVYVTKEVDADGETKVVRKVKIHKGEGLSKEEIDEIMIEVKEGLAEADVAIADAHRIAVKMAGEAGENHVMIEMSCDGDEMVSESITDDGKKVMKICKTHVMASALEGLREARRELAADEELTSEIRERVLKELDSKIAEWEKKGS